MKKMRIRHSVRPEILSINFTNAIPKRVLLISSVLASFGNVQQICWKRFERGNASLNVHYVRGASFVSFLLKLSILLLSKRYDILFFDDTRLLPLAVVLGKIKRLKLIYNRMEVPTIKAAQKVSNWSDLSNKNALKIVESIESLWARKVDAVLTIPLVKNDIKRLEDWGRPILTIWNVPNFENRMSFRNSDFCLSEEPITLIYSGAITHENGLVSYLRLVRHLNERFSGRKVRLVLIGRLWKFSICDLNFLISREKCENLVEYREWISYEKLMDLLTTADIGLAMSDPNFEKYKHMNEGASRKIFTYMAAGLPIIAGGSFGKVVEEVNAGYFVNYDDVDGMLAAVQNIISDPDLSRSMSENGRLAIQNQYNWKNESEKLSDFFKSLNIF